MRRGGFAPPRWHLISTNDEGIPSFLHAWGGFNAAPPIFDATGVVSTPPPPFPTRTYVTRRGTPLLVRVSMRTDATTRGIPPLGVFLFTQTRRGGVLPFSFVFLCTQTRRGGPPPLVRVSIQRGGDLPFLFVFLLTQTRREGVSPFSASFCSHRHDEEGSPPPRHLLSMLCEREGSTPPLSTPFDTTREGATPSRLLLTAFDEGSTPSPLLFDAFRVGLTHPLLSMPFDANGEGSTPSPSVFIAIGWD